MTNEEIKNIYNDYKNEVYSIINDKKNGAIKSKTEFIDILNNIHTLFTNNANDLYVHNDISSSQWETLLVASFKLYRKAVHSL